jgi:hypothetical protein
VKVISALLFNNQLAISLGGQGSSIQFSEDQNKERAMVTDITWRKTLAPEAWLTLLRDEGRISM